MDMMKQFSLEGKVALITGAAYGIGFAIAEAYANCGAKIAFNCRGEKHMEEAMKAYGVVSQLMVLTLSLSLFFAFLIWEFIIPLFLHNGTTVGKKIFGLCVMRTNCVKINGVSLFIRAILGKYTIETMIPAYLIMMVFMGSIGIVAPIVVCGILVFQLILLFSTKKNQLIHCILSDTCVVDYASQMIYENEEALLEAMKMDGKEKAQNDPYY